MSENIKTSLPLEIIRRYRVFPKKENDKKITLYAPGELAKESLDEIEFLTGKKVKTEKKSEEKINQLIEKNFGIKERLSEIVESESGIEEVKSTSESSEKEIKTVSSTQVKVLDHIIGSAIEKRASDIHFEKYEKAVRLKFRIDGVLREEESFPGNYYENVISRIKILSNLDIGERRLPQDGKFTFRVKDKDFDLRVSIMPSFFAESCVIRILQRDKEILTLEDLGFYKEDIEILKRCANNPQGLILVNGPTGSGKTTTLYSLLSLMNIVEKKVVTIEDPIEYFFEGILQMQVKPSIGFDFAGGLRGILRHDPDVIMVGEIRDSETAEIALRSALTGHLVLSTVHTNDNISTILRLMNLGVDRHLISQSLSLLVTQRLVRKICPECKGKGRSECRECGGTGYLGRTVVYEVLEVGDELRELIARGDAGKGAVVKVLRKSKNSTMKTVMARKVGDGVTDLGEVGKAG